MTWGLFLALSAAAPSAQWLGPRPTRVARIVSLAPSATEVLFALGAGERVVGVTRFDNFPPAVATLPKVGGFIDPDPEAVLTLTPDLVVAIRTSGGREPVDTLVRLGATVLVLPAESIADLWATIAALGDAIGARAQATALAARLQREIAAVGQSHAGLPPARVLLVVGHRPLVAAGRGTYLDSLLALVGATNVVDHGGAYPSLDLEAAVTLDPDVIVDLTLSMHEGGAAFWQELHALRAVRDGRVVHIEHEGLLRLGPRLPAGLALLGDAIHRGSPPVHP